MHLPPLTFGTEETPLDRELQATELARIMANSYPQPVFFLGYVVTKPHAPRRKHHNHGSYASNTYTEIAAAPYDIMVSDGRVHDIDKEDYDRWCVILPHYSMLEEQLTGVV